MIGHLSLTPTYVSKDVRWQENIEVIWKEQFVAKLNRKHNIDIDEIDLTRVDLAAIRLLPQILRGGYIC